MAKNTTKSGGAFDFIQKILDVFGGGINAETEKKRQLKQIAKELGKVKFKFYKASSSEVLSSLGKLFYEIYKAVYSAQTMFNSLANPNAIKNAIIDFTLTDKQKELAEELAEETIQARSKDMSIEQNSAKVKQDLDALMSGFDGDKINQIDALYNRALAFKAFCTYDYYFMLKKFDSSIQEGNFNNAPKLNTISGEYIIEDLKDFMAIAWALPMDDEWAQTVDFINTIRKFEVIKAGVFRKIVARVRAVRMCRVLEMMVQHISKDPLWQINVPLQNEHVVDAYLSGIRKQSESALEELRRTQKAKKSEDLMTQVFGTTSVVILKNYNDIGSASFQKRGLEGFTYQQALNCLKTFLLEFIKKDVREYADLVLVRATWTTAQLATPMSDAYHDLLSASDSITEFDNKLADDGEYGTKFKNWLPRMERDKEAANMIRTLLRDINDTARDFIITCTKNLVLFAKTTKSLLEDHQKSHSDIVINWKEVEHFAEHDINDLGVGIYKKIYIFVQLMQSYLGN